MKNTTTPIRGDDRFIRNTELWGMAVAAGFVCLALIVAFHSQPGHKGSVNASDGDPIFVTPNATVTATAQKPLHLTLDTPALSDQQRAVQHEAQAMPRCPICFGVDKPPVKFSDNEATVFAALIYSECSYLPYDEYGNFKVNEIGARGCAQLMGDLVTPENMWSVELNMYDGAREFRRLLDVNDGEIMAALAQYKGSTDASTHGQVLSPFAVIKIGG